MIDVNRLRRRHERCGCLLRVGPAASDASPTFTYRRCRLSITGLVLAIECDVCQAFVGDSRKRPDLMLLRVRDGELEWLVTEVKSVMDGDALEQVQAGIDIAGSSTMFGPAQVGATVGLFAFRKANRTADMDRLRGGLKMVNKPVTSLVKRCGAAPT